MRLSMGEGVFSFLWNTVFPYLGDVFGYIYSLARMNFGNFIDWLVGSHTYGFYGNTVPVGTYYLNFSYINPFRINPLTNTNEFFVSIRSIPDALGSLSFISWFVTKPYTIVVKGIFDIFDFIGFGWCFNLPTWFGVPVFSIFVMLLLKFIHFIVNWATAFVSVAFRAIR